VSLHGGLARAFRLLVIGVASALSACTGNVDRNSTPEVAGPRAASTDSQALLKSGSAGSTRTLSFETDEGTNMGVDVSPDGKTLLFDLLGDLYILPIAGGEAVPISQGPAWDKSARFSPDGAEAFFVSDRKGFKNVWALTLSDRSLRQVTNLSQDVAGDLNWTLPGSALLAGIRTETDVFLHLIDPAEGRIREVEGKLPRVGPSMAGASGRRRIWNKVYSAVGSTDGELYFSELLRLDMQGESAEAPRTAIRVHRFEWEERERKPLTPSGAAYDEFKPQLSGDGTLLAYFRQYLNGESELRVRDLENNTDRKLAVLENVNDPTLVTNTTKDDLRPNYAFTPDNASIVLWNDGKLHRIDVDTAQREIIPFNADVGIDVLDRAIPPAVDFREITAARTILWPELSRDKKIVVFAANGFIWVRDNETGAVRRVTESTAGFEYMPALSPDRTSVAYVSYEKVNSEQNAGKLMIANFDTGESREIRLDADAPPGVLGLPRWSNDGSMIAFFRRSQTGTEVGFYSKELERYFRVASAGFGGRNYAMFLSFNRSDDKLIYSHQNSARQSILKQTDLDGRNTDILAVGDREVGGIAPAPDLRKLAVTRRDRSIWLVSLPVDGEIIRVSPKRPDALRVGESGGNFISWHTENAFTFSSGAEFFDYDVTNGELSLHTIRVPTKPVGSGKKTAYRGARLIALSDDAGAGPIINKGTIVVQDGRIAAVGDIQSVEIPSDAFIVDVSGMTIMPGLLDSHYHASLWSDFYFPRQTNPYSTPFEDKTALEYGITSAWAAGSHNSFGGAIAADFQMSNRIAGPRWSYAGGYIGQDGYRYDESYENLEAAAKFLKENGVHVMKEYDAPTRTESRWIARAARANGLGVVSHLESFEEMMTRVVDGYTGGDHSVAPDTLYRDVHQLLAQTGYVYTPHLSSTGVLRGTGSIPLQYYLAELTNRKPEFEITEDNPRVADYLQNIEEPDTPYKEHPVNRLEKAVVTMAENGASIGVAGHHHPGFFLHQDMWHLRNGGMSIENVLRSVTVTNAEKLGLQNEVGSLEIGKIADFLILSENPLDDILNTLSIQYTVQGGLVYDAATAERIAPEALQARFDPGRAANDDAPMQKKTSLNDFSSLHELVP